MDNVSKVVGCGLCSGCGTCVGMCPSNALSIRILPRKGVLVPSVDVSKCTGCGLCVEVCPGKGIRFSEFMVDAGTGDAHGLPAGVAVGCWSGSSSHVAVRSISSSGGLITSLLIHSLSSKIVDGAIVVRMNTQHPLKAEPFIARSPDEIMDGAGSKYLPVAMNSLLREVMDSGGRYIAVGLPCHIHGLRLAQRAEPLLRDRIPICMGLVCHHTPCYLSMEFLLADLKLKAGDVRRVDYRVGGWPGSLRFTLNDGTMKEVPYTSKRYWGGLLQSHFVPERCMMCIDKMSVLSDLSFMDGWRIHATGCPTDSELVVSRTAAGDKLLRSAASDKSVVLRPMNEEDVLRSQDVANHYRRRYAMIESARRRGQSVPEYGQQRSSVKRHELMDARIAFIVNAMSCRREMWPEMRLLASLREAGQRIRRSHRDSRRES